jgi:hypothetical protein
MPRQSAIQHILNQAGSATPPYIDLQSTRWGGNAFHPGTLIPPQTFSFTTGLVSVPIFSITMLTVSPAFI